MNNETWSDYYKNNYNKPEEFVTFEDNRYIKNTTTGNKSLDESIYNGTIAYCKFSNNDNDDVLYCPKLDKNNELKLYFSTLEEVRGCIYSYRVSVFMKVVKDNNLDIDDFILLYRPEIITGNIIVFFKNGWRTFNTYGEEIKNYRYNKGYYNDLAKKYKKDHNNNYPAKHNIKTLIKIQLLKIIYK